MTDDQFLRLMEHPDNGYHFVRKLPNGKWVGLHKLTFTIGLFVGLDESGYEYRYCYNNWGEAILAVTQWDGKNDAPGYWVVRKGLPGGDYANPNRK